MSLPARLRELREASGLSQAKIAALTGVTRNAVSQWESGETRPSMRRLSMLAKTYGLSVEQLLDAAPKGRQSIIDAAIRLFDRLGVDNASIADICVAAECSKDEFNSFFHSKEALVFEAGKIINQQTVADLRRAPPSYGSVAAKLKYFIHRILVNDLAHLDLVAANHAYSWRWDAVCERESNHLILEYQDAIAAILEAAATRDQIRRGNFRAAAQLILSAYTFALRKAVHGDRDAERVMQAITPHLTLVLDAFGFVDIPGFSEERKL